ncbi:MAG: ArsR/SmtB family transcription factor [Burkholderiaceae bacterium]|jgi:DNA-binding transcriptional ArsR family regulator
MDSSLSREQRAVLFEEVAGYFSLLSEPTRLKILHAVCEGERTVGEIVSHVESTQANVSRQINMLYRAKILSRRKEGTQVFYRIADQKTIDLCQSVCGDFNKAISMSVSLKQDIKAA